MTPLFSTAYFPPIAYVAALMQHTDVLIETQETYPKQTYRNRMNIMTAGGIRTLEDLNAFLDAGCERIGTSAAVGLLKETL